jgi:hypothetical protein
MLSKKIVMALSAALGFVSINAFAAAGESQTIVLSTDVASSCTIESSSSSFSPNLVAGESSTTIATITEVCNDMDGFTVTFSSANGGLLQNSDVAAQKKAYQIDYADVSGQLGADRVQTYGTGTESNVVPLKMSLAANTGVLASGTWSDTITATVAVVD